MMTKLMEPLRDDQANGACGAADKRTLCRSVNRLPADCIASCRLSHWAGAGYINVLPVARTTSALGLPRHNSMPPLRAAAGTTILFRRQNYLYCSDEQNCSVCALALEHRFPATSLTMGSLANPSVSDGPFVHPSNRACQGAPTLRPKRPLPLPSYGVP